MTHQSHEQSIRPDHKPSRGVESKLAVPDGSVEALEALLRTTDAGHVARRHEVTTYFDTERWNTAASACASALPTGSAFKP